MSERSEFLKAIKWSNDMCNGKKLGSEGGKRNNGPVSVDDVAPTSEGNGRRH